MTHTLPMFTAGEELPLFTGQPATYQPATFQPKPYYRQLRLEQETSTMIQQTVRIPACDEHEGWKSIVVTLDWVCPTCGQPRGVPHKATSYDGSRRLHCDGWENPCGHVDKYSALRIEAVDMGLRPTIQERAAHAVETLTYGMGKKYIRGVCICYRGDNDYRVNELRGLTKEQAIEQLIGTLEVLQP